MVAPHSQHVALTRVNIRAPALAMVHRTGWQCPPGEKASAAPRRPPRDPFLLTSRKNYPCASLLRKATSAEWRARAGSARGVVSEAAQRAMADGTRKARAGRARFAASKPAQLTAGIAAAAAISTLAATAPWAGATASTAASTADVARGGPAPAISAHTTADPVKAKAAATPEAKAAATPAVKAKPAAPATPETFYDSVAPTAIPAGQHVATYANGPYQASGAAVAGRGTVLWIDTNGTNTQANALDVEPGDATPTEAASWVSAKLAANPRSEPIVYTFEAEWGSVQSNIKALPSWMQSHVKYWIADPTGTPHIVPGASATQWYWGSSYDISMAQPGFFK